MTAAGGLLNGRRLAPRGPHVDELRRKDKKETGYGELYARDCSHPLLQHVKPSTFKVFAICTANAFAKQGYIFDASFNELAAKCGLNKRTVERAAAELRALGLLESVSNWGAYPGWRNPGWQKTRWHMLRPSETLSDEELGRLVVLAKRGPYADDALPSVMMGGEAARRRWQREQLRIEAEAAAEASARNLAPALERVCGELARCEARILSWPDVPAPFGPVRFQRPETVGAAWTARGLVQAARLTCWDLWARVLEVLPQVSGVVELREGHRWAYVYSAARVAVELLGALVAVVERAAKAVHEARAGWMALVRHNDAIEVSQESQASTGWSEDLDLDVEQEDDTESPPRIGETWRPPRRWDPVDGDRSAAGWEDQARQYRDASEIGGRLGEKIRRALLDRGFRPDWPEPGLSAWLAAAGRDPPRRRR